MKAVQVSDINSFYQALLELRSRAECRRFLRDLLTEEEINEFAARWKIARMLDRKTQYEIIQKETGMSSTTIARVSKWLNKGKGGYKLVLKRMKKIRNINIHHVRLLR